MHINSNAMAFVRGGILMKGSLIGWAVLLLIVVILAVAVMLAQGFLGNLFPGIPLLAVDAIIVVIAAIILWFFAGVFQGIANGMKKRRESGGSGGQ